jgi:hypothetical protein
VQVLVPVEQAALKMDVEQRADPGEPIVHNP